MSRSFVRIAAAPVLLAAFAFPQMARAHAVLVDSTPKANETVHGPSIQIHLKFNSRVDGARSTVQLALEDGSVHTLELSSQATQDEIVTHADGLSKGSYSIRWQALSSDGHLTRGQIPFLVDK
ncbi:MAG TPA: copper resistance CopC family protein [Acidobacteriaceae bacterium]